MEDFRASAPEQRGPANPNVESVPFEEMKERILKIVDGYNGWVAVSEDGQIANSSTALTRRPSHVVCFSRNLIDSAEKWELMHFNQVKCFHLDKDKTDTDIYNHYPLHTKFLL